MRVRLIERRERKKGRVMGKEKVSFMVMSCPFVPIRFKSIESDKIEKRENIFRLLMTVHDFGQVCLVVLLVNQSHLA